MRGISPGSREGLSSGQSGGPGALGTRMPSRSATVLTPLVLLTRIGTNKWGDIREMRALTR